MGESARPRTARHGHAGGTAPSQAAPLAEAICLVSAWNPFAVLAALAFIPHASNALSHANMTLGKLISLWDKLSTSRAGAEVGE